MSRRQRKPGDNVTDTGEVEELKRSAAIRKWAKNAAAKLLMVSEMNNTPPRREHLYSARIDSHVRERYRVTLSDDESIATNLSLLSCSTEEDCEIINNGRSKRHKRRKKKAVDKVETEPPPKTIDWQQIARDSRPSLLNKMLDRDVTAMSSYCGGSTFQRRQTVYDVLNEHERALLKLTAFTSGLCSMQKSSSTENVLSAIVTNERTRLPSRFRLHSLNRIMRPKSAPGIITSHGDYCQSDMNQGVFSSLDFMNIPHTPRTYPLRSSRSRITFSSLPDFDSKVKITNEGRSRVRRAVTALGRLTDKPSTSSQHDVIANDYNTTPTYSHPVRITYQLRDVIEKDLRHRMGFRRQNGIATSDMKEFDAKQPALGRTHRNLLIFNWLSTVDETAFMFQGEPEIREIDDEPPVRITYRAPLVNLSRRRRPYTQESGCTIQTEVSTLSLGESCITHARKNLSRSIIRVP